VAENERTVLTAVRNGGRAGGVERCGGGEPKERRALAFPHREG
jgi:hypothetical protein